MEENINSEISGAKRIILSILGVLALLVAVIGVSFAIFRVTQTSEANSISTGTIKMNYTESSNGIFLKNALPITDEVGTKLMDDGEYFDFSVTTTASGEYSITYQINVTEKEGSTLDKKNIKIYLTRIVDGYEEEIIAPTILSLFESSNVRMNAIKIADFSDKHIGEESQTNKYRLRMWVSYNADANLIADSDYALTVNVDTDSSVK